MLLTIVTTHTASKLNLKSCVHYKDLFITNKVEATDHKYKIATFRVLCGDQLLEIVKPNEYDKKQTFDEVKQAVIKHYGYQVNKLVAKKKFECEKMQVSKTLVIIMRLNHM